MKRALPWLVYLACVVAFFEIAARLALGNRDFLRRVAVNDDASWRLRWLAQRGSQGALHVLDDWSPTLGWRPKPGLRDVDAFGGRLLNTNARGLRGRRDYAYEKAPGVFRIVALGDSFTFGEEVGDDDAWPHQLERLLPGVEVVNLGVHGYGHDQMLLYLQQEGIRYQPDVVLLGFVSDDMLRNVLRFRDYAKPRFTLVDGKLVAPQGSVPPPEETLAALRLRPRLLDLVAMLREANRIRTGQQYREAQQLTLALLDAMRRTSEAAGARPAFVYLPVFGELTKPDLPKTMRERFFFGYCEEQGIPGIYLRPYFLPRLEEGAEFKVYGHWAPLEHRIAAEGIAAELRAQGLLPAQAAVRE